MIKGLPNCSVWVHCFSLLFSWKQQLPTKHHGTMCKLFSAFTAGAVPFLHVEHDRLLTLPNIYKGWWVMVLLKLLASMNREKTIFEKSLLFITNSLHNQSINIYLNLLEDFTTSQSSDFDGLKSVITWIYNTKLNFSSRL